jgi:hypothetical protein
VLCSIPDSSAYYRVLVAAVDVEEVVVADEEAEEAVPA